MKNFVVILFSIFIIAPAFGQDFDYLPKEIPGHQIIAYSQFTISYNEEHEQPDWVAYELTGEEATTKRDRCNCFEKDENITSHSATKKDYSSTGFDRGHLSPAADNNASEQANRESFLMSNMSPQLPGFNRGIWADLEAWVRDQAEAHGTIYVVTGPVFINNLGKIGTNEVTIPGYFYKIILRFDGTKVKTIGFLLPQLGAVGHIQDYVVPVNAIESMTGIDFYPDLLSSSENRVEAQYELGTWGF